MWILGLKGLIERSTLPEFYFINYFIKLLLFYFIKLFYKIINDFQNFGVFPFVDSHQRQCDSCCGRCCLL